MAKSTLSEIQRSLWAGRRYGRLTVIANPEPHQLKVLCKCKCGVTKAIAKSSLMTGSTQSCGCLQKELVQKRFTKHGASKANGRDEMYSVWAGMVNRCCNPNNYSYSLYGGRGITVSTEWRYNYLQFMADMGRRPTKKHHIDRIDNEKGYSKENCRWVLCAENSKNRRNNRSLTMFGRTEIISDWSRILSISQFTMYTWLNKYPIPEVISKVQERIAFKYPTTREIQLQEELKDGYS